VDSDREERHGVPCPYMAVQYLDLTEDRPFEAHGKQECLSYVRKGEPIPISAV